MPMPIIDREQRAKSQWPGTEVVLGPAPVMIQEWKNKVLDALKLTDKQREVANLMLQGFNSKEIANITNNTEKTIKHHIRSIFDKSKTNTRSEFFAEVFCL